MTAVVTKVIAPTLRATTLRIAENSTVVVSVTNNGVRVTDVRLGMPGPAGASGASSTTLKHNQVGASASWTIVHGLGYYPNVQIFDNDDTLLVITPTHVSINEVRLDFPYALSGYAILS